MFTKPALPELFTFSTAGRWTCTLGTLLTGRQGVSQIVLYPALGDKILTPQIYYLPEQLPGLNKQKEPWGTYRERLI